MKYNYIQIEFLAIFLFLICCLSYNALLKCTYSFWNILYSKPYQKYCFKIHIIYKNMCFFFQTHRVDCRKEGNGIMCSWRGRWYPLILMLEWHHQESFLHYCLHCSVSGGRRGLTVLPSGVHSRSGQCSWCWLDNLRCSSRLFLDTGKWKYFFNLIEF